jgi:hypothetical protein
LAARVTPRLSAIYAQRAAGWIVGVAGAAWVFDRLMP